MLQQYHFSSNVSQQNIPVIFPLASHLGLVSYIPLYIPISFPFEMYAPTVFSASQELAITSPFIDDCPYSFNISFRFDLLHGKSSEFCINIGLGAWGYGWMVWEHGKSYEKRRTGGSPVTGRPHHQPRDPLFGIPGAFRCERRGRGQRTPGAVVFMAPEAILRGDFQSLGGMGVHRKKSDPIDSNLGGC